MVYIIILNWKGTADTISCLTSLKRLRGANFRIVVCDNASPDGSYEAIRSRLSQDGDCFRELTNSAAFDELTSRQDQEIYLIQTGSNMGYAGGNNVGVRFALAQSEMTHVWLLNNDTEVDDHALEALLSKFQRFPRIGICGSKLVYHHDRGHLQGYGGRFNKWLWLTSHYGENQPAEEELDENLVDSKIDYIIGASMMIRREVIEKIGLLCEDYFLYYEEIDFCLRARKHYTLGVAVDSLVYHKEGASTGGGKKPEIDACAVGNRLRIAKKFNPPSVPIVWVSLFFVILNRLRRGQYKNALAIGNVIVFPGRKRP